MKLKSPINENYAATVVTIKNIIPLANCDNVVHSNIFGNLVVVGKSDTKVGDRGLFFPVETRLSDEFLHENNLYRDKQKNKDTNEKGYFEDNGRIRCVKFRGNKSEGLFLPLGSLLFCSETPNLASIETGATFDEVNGLKICEKYIPRFSQTQSEGGKKGKKGKKNKYKKVPRIVDGQFRLHEDTAQLGKNIFKIIPGTILSITNKLHGTSFVVGKVLCKKKLSFLERILRFFGFNIVDTHYDVIYSSRKVVKNDDLNKVQHHFYGEDLWGDIAAQLTPYLMDGMTIYGEAVGFTQNGRPIQGGYDYGYPKQSGCASGDEQFGIYIYRVTLTDPKGIVFEFPARAVQDWCKEHGLNPVPEFFYGKANELVPYPEEFIIGESDAPINTGREEWQAALLAKLQSSYSMEELCYMCKEKVPAEGLVVRLEVPQYDAYKLKSFRFRERETKQLDSGEVDLETQESQVE